MARKIDPLTRRTLIMSDNYIELYGKLQGSKTITKEDLKLIEALGSAAFDMGYMNCLKHVTKIALHINCFPEFEDVITKEYAKSVMAGIKRPTDTIAEALKEPEKE